LEGVVGVVEEEVVEVVGEASSEECESFSE
jgi:hypothetical protein